MQALKRIEIQGRQIILLGTAHISKESIDEVSTLIREEGVDRVCVELDEQRYQSMKNPENWRSLDIVKVLKSGQGFMLLANLVLSSFQRRMGENVGISPGDEMKAAIAESEALGIPFSLVDRSIQITLRRAWAKNSLWGKCKLAAALLSSAFETERVSAEQIEELKNKSAMDSMMGELSSYLPKVKEVLIDERDQYLASHIWQAEGSKVVAVLGAGHLDGVESWIHRLAEGSASSDTSQIDIIPSPGIGGKIAGWIFPLLIVGLIAAGFFTGGVGASVDMLVRWLLWNGSLAALGALIALAHPFAIIASFVCAPIATLNPVLGVGMFSGLVQAWVRKPKVSDMENLMQDITSVKGFYRNRISRVLLVFFLASLGGAIGNFIAVPALVTSLI
ncbi:MAG: TraB/GumN family protein [Spirochaetaceae bacterium]|jgi:pheromone shutdown-related protein TraB|nr:TraB/GumN family protein [Spirochaetaceae bacterium]